MSDIPSYDDLLHELGDETRKQRKTIKELELRLAEAEKNYNWRLEKCFGFRDATDLNCENCPPILLKCCVIATKKALRDTHEVKNK